MRPRQSQSTRLAAQVLTVICFCFAVALVAAPALAQEWPSGTVRVVVPYAAGGPVDVPARLLIDRLAGQTKSVFILEDRPGRRGSHRRAGRRAGCARRRHLAADDVVGDDGPDDLSQARVRSAARSHL